MRYVGRKDCFPILTTSFVGVGHCSSALYAYDLVNGRLNFARIKIYSHCNTMPFVCSLLQSKHRWKYVLNKPCTFNNSRKFSHQL